MAEPESLPPEQREAMDALTGPDSPLVQQWAKEWAHFDARAVEAWSNLALYGEHTLPDGATLQCDAYGNISRTPDSEVNHGD